MGLFSSITHAASGAVGSITHGGGGFGGIFNHLPISTGGIWKPVSHIPGVSGAIKTGGKIAGGVYNEGKTIVHSGNNVISGFGSAAAGLGNLFSSPVFMYGALAVGGLVAYKVVTK